MYPDLFSHILSAVLPIHAWELAKFGRPVTVIFWLLFFEAGSPFALGPLALCLR